MFGIVITTSLRAVGLSPAPPGDRTVLRLSRRRLTAVLFTVAVLLVGGAMPAVAHRDGCHRWHSCPSDSGSYVCGDLGYTSQCPGTTETTVPDVDTSVPDFDYDAPALPRLGKAAAGAKGAVKFTIVAERRSKVAVTEDGKTVARATGTGSRQTIRFSARTGSHSYVVTATDRAGNTSDEGTVQVAVDADAPKVTAVQATSPTPTEGAAAFSFTTEPGATYTLAVPGQKTIRATAATASVTHRFWLRNGTYPATLKVTDRVGNATTTKRALKVAFARPALTVNRSTPDNADSTTFDVTATPRSTGVVALPGVDPIAFKVPDAGRATVQSALPDGAYPAGTVTLTDFGGRRATTVLPAFTIDTAPPTLVGTVDRVRLRDGLTRLALRTERGVSVTLTATVINEQDGATAPVTATMAAADGALQWEPSLPAGTYTVTAVATDAADNATTFTDRITVEDPLTGAEIALILGVLFVLLLLAAAAALLLWVNRHRIATWRQERARKAALLAEQRAIAQIRLRYEAAVVEHRSAMARYERDHAAWATQRTHLAGLVAIAEEAHPQLVSHYGVVKLKPGERVYGTIAATLVEQRSRQGQPTLVAVGEGQLAITDTRLVFDGTKNREWRFANLTDVTITGDDIVLMSVTNRKSLSGVRASASGPTWDRDHTLLMTALAQAAGQRADLVADLRRRRDDHDRRRPTPPPAPAVPDALNTPAASPAGQ